VVSIYTGTILSIVCKDISKHSKIHVCSLFYFKNVEFEAAVPLW
jgi:hypothetical protein